MGILSFFKKKLKQTKEEGLSSEESLFKDIPKFIKTKKQEIINNQQKPLKEIKINISEFIIEVKEKAKALENFDLSEKKVPERAKQIVKQNLDNFLHYLAKLISNLNELETKEEVSFKELITKTKLIFLDFEKKSIPSYQKATFLVGKELEDTKNIISKFLKSFETILDNCAYQIKQFDIISLVELKLKEFNELNKTEIENLNKLTQNNQRIEYYEENIEKIQKDIEKIKQTNEYINQTKKNKEFEKQKLNLSKEIQKLKGLIDFKLLAQVYHSSEKQMKLIKEYKEDFKETFEKYTPEKITELTNIKEADKESIKVSLKNIEEIKLKIKNIKINPDKTKQLEEEVNTLKLKIEDIKNEIFKIEKVNIRVKYNKEKIKQEITNELEEIKVKII